MKSKEKGKSYPCNVVCAFTKEVETDVASITDSEEEEIVLVTKQSAPPMNGTRSGQQYLKKYDEAMPSFSKPTKEPAK